MIIGVAGEKKHGKDTVAAYLVKNYGYKQRAFADNLKGMCWKVFNINLADMYDEHKKEIPFENLQYGKLFISPKHIAQILIAIVDEGYSVHHRDIISIVSKLAKKAYFTSIRDMLQFIGTDILRDMVDADFHYNSVVRYFKHEAILKGVISDVRFPNERDNLPKDFPNSITILVVRPHLQKNETSLHKSETSLGDRNDYTYTILNDGTLEELYQKIDYIMTNHSKE